MRRLLTWLTMLDTPVSADPIEVANRLRPVLLQLNRELRREIIHFLERVRGHRSGSNTPASPGALREETR